MPLSSYLLFFGCCVLLAALTFVMYLRAGVPRAEAFVMTFLFTFVAISLGGFVFLLIEVMNAVGDLLRVERILGKDAS